MTAGTDQDVPAPAVSGRLGFPLLINVAAMANTKDEIALCRSGIDDAVVPDAKAVEAFELACQRLTALSFGPQRPLNLVLNSPGDRWIKRFKIRRNRSLVLNL